MTAQEAKQQTDAVNATKPKPVDLILESVKTNIEMGWFSTFWGSELSQVDIQILENLGYKVSPYEDKNSLIFRHIISWE